MYAIRSYYDQQARLPAAFAQALGEGLASAWRGHDERPRLCCSTRCRGRHLLLDKITKFLESWLALQKETISTIDGRNNFV